jgi:hypothetical protein
LCSVLTFDVSTHASLQIGDAAIITQQPYVEFSHSLGRKLTSELFPFSANTGHSPGAEMQPILNIPASFAAYPGRWTLPQRYKRLISGEG